MIHSIISEEEKVKISELNSKKEKLQYIWDYYKFPILGAVALVCIVVYFLVVFATRQADPALTVVFVNNYDDLSADSEISVGFEEYAGDRLTGAIKLDNNAFFNLANQSDYRNSYYMKVLAYLEGGTTQAVVCEYDNLMGLARSGRLLDLSDDKVAGLCDRYKEKLVYYENEDGTKTPAGIDITEGLVAQGINIDKGSRVYIGLSGFADSYELAQLFIEFLIETGK